MISPKFRHPHARDQEHMPFITRKKFPQVSLRLSTWREERNLADKEEYDREYCDRAVCDGNLNESISGMYHKNDRASVP